MEILIIMMISIGSLNLHSAWHQLAPCIKATPKTTDKNYFVRIDLPSPDTVCVLLVGSKEIIHTAVLLLLGSSLQKLMQQSGLPHSQSFTLHALLVLCTE